ncbi:MAG: fibronectin type III domain-containing protein [Lewinellaceae bacterium]|nr:fibronectin type III domain-containing protein [Lewinellaceae bacterium]
MEKRYHYALLLFFLVHIIGLLQAQDSFGGRISVPAGYAFPDCESPLNARIGLTGSSFILVNWDEPKDAYGVYSYELRYRESGAQSWKTAYLNRRMGFEIQHLQPEHGYEIELRRICSHEPELFSPWAKLGVCWTLSEGDYRSNSSEVCGWLTEAEFGEVSPGRVQITWNGPAATNSSYRYQIRYRYTQNGTTSNWVEAFVVIGNEFLLANLQNIATYEFEIRLVWGGQGQYPTDYCNWLKVGAVSIYGGDVNDEEPGPEITLPPFDCGDTFVGITADPSNALASAGPGDVFNINGFPVLLMSVSGGNGVFSGQGLVPLPFGQQTVQVSFSGVNVNASKQIWSGSLIATSDDPGNYPDFTIDTISIGVDICIPPVQADGFDENGIHSATGQPWDERGFNQNGEYVRQPPYPGWQAGDTTSLYHDPNGFNAQGIHAITGTLYNENNCSQQGFDPNGQPCNPEGPGPYYWLTGQHTSPTQAGIALASQVQGILEPILIDTWNLYLGRATDSLTAVQSRCNGIRDEMDNILLALGYERSFIFGENDQYFGEGMSANFTAEPKPLGLNIVRNAQHETLEEQHVELWHCDTALMKLQCSRDFIIAQLQSNAIDELAAGMLEQIQRFSPEDAATYSDSLNLVAWVQGIVADRIKQHCNIGSEGIGAISPLQNEGKGWRKSPLLPSRILASPAEGPGMLLASLEEEGQALLQSFELEQEDISFLFQQGFEYIGGVHRAYYLEALARKKAAAPPSGNNLLPVVVEKELFGRTYKIYLDNITFSPQGATMDAYFILEIPTSGDRLVFRALNVPFGPTGASVDTRLELGTDVRIRLSNAASLTIKGSPDTYVAWDCEGFAGMGIDAEIEFCREYVVPLDTSSLEPLPEPERVRAYFTADMPAWGEFIAQLDFDPFAINGLEDIKWEVYNAWLDFSESASPANIAFPINYGSPFVNAAGQASPLWKGFYLQELSVTLPDNLTAQTAGQQGGTGASVTISVSDVIIDDRG